MSKRAFDECEDCEETLPKGQRRRRCRRCRMLVCGWCYNHVHAIDLSGFNPKACAAAESGEKERAK
jgi:hypothetical protein